MSNDEARGLLNPSSAWIPTMVGIVIARLLLHTAWPRRTSECPQTFDVKGLTYESLLSADIRMDTFWSFGSLELDQFVDRKKFLKTRIWTQRAETGEYENLNFAFGMPPGNAYKHWETKICRIHQSIHISIISDQ